MYPCRKQKWKVRNECLSQINQYKYIYELVLTRSQNMKVATLKSLIKRAFMISSTKVTLDKELTHLKEVFTGYNQYPLKLVEEIIKNETRQHERIEFPG